MLLILIHTNITLCLLYYINPGLFYDNFSQKLKIIIQKHCNYLISMLLWNRKEEMDTQTTRKVILSFEILAGGYLAETGSLQNLTYLFLRKDVSVY